jgi:hypothetical protein
MTPRLRIKFLSAPTEDFAYRRDDCVALFGQKNLPTIRANGINFDLDQPKSWSGGVNPSEKSFFIQTAHPQITITVNSFPFLCEQEA